MRIVVLVVQLFCLMPKYRDIFGLIFLTWPIIDLCICLHMIVPVYCDFYHFTLC